MAVSSPLLPERYGPEINIKSEVPIKNEIPSRNNY